MRFSGAALVLWFSLTGCSIVTSTAPLGDPVAADDTKKLEGVWLGSDGDPFYARHVRENELRVAGIEWKHSKYRLAEFTLFLTEEEERRYLNMLDTEHQDVAPRYYIMRVEGPDDDYLVLTPPRAEPFAKAVEDGKLSGTVTKKDDHVTVRLDSSAEKLGEFVTPLKVADQFDLDAREIFRRVRRFDENNE